MRSGRTLESLVGPLAGLLLALPLRAFAQTRGKAQSLLRDAEKAMRAEDFRGAEGLYRAAADPESPERTGREASGLLFPRGSLEV